MSAQESSSHPSPDLSPVEVCEKQLQALQRGDVEACFRFASPANKANTGPWQRFEMMIRQTPAYAPLVGCTRFAIVGALPTGGGLSGSGTGVEGYRCRVRVWPAGGSSAPFAVATPVIDYDWLLTREDGDAEPSLADCWLVDGVMPDASPRDAWDSARGD